METSTNFNDAVGEGQNSGAQNADHQNGLKSILNKNSEQEETPEEIHAPVSSPRVWNFLKKGVKEFEINAFESSAERQDFDAEVQDAAEQGLSVEYVSREGKIAVIMELVGEKLGKAGARRAMDRALDDGNIEAYIELILHAQGAAGQMGQLIPDLCCYPLGFTYAYRGDTPPHPPIVVEINWIEDSNTARNKVNFYFTPTFVAPDGSMVNEVWNLFLARAAPTLPALTVPPLTASVHTETLPLTSVDTILHAATTTGAEEPTIIVFHHRHAAYPPSYGLLDWNTALAAPAGSLFTDRLDANAILCMMYYQLH